MSAPGLLPSWAPTADDVAKVTASYTRGGFDDDSDEFGGEGGVYDDDSLPTATQVSGYIAAACDEVEGRVGVAIPDRCFKLAKATAVWHAAMTIAAGKQPIGTEETTAQAANFTRNFINSLAELSTQARMGPVRLS